jgi:hypothetical protein
MNKEKVERPVVVEDKHLKYLDDLRKSGRCNMWGAGVYLSSVFGMDMDIDTANTVLGYWMDSFDERHPV